MKKGMIVLIVIIAVLVIGTVIRLSLSSKQKKAAADEKQALSVEAVRTMKGDVSRSSEMIGNVLADKTAQVFPETMGRVARIMVREGSYVAKGDQLMAIKSESVGFEFEESYITAPIAGVVGKIMTEVGSMVAPQAPAALVVDYSRVKVSFNVAEIDAGSLRLNKNLTVTVDALPDEKFSGAIAEISPVIDPMTRTIAVKVLLYNPKSLLKPGMTARVRLSLGDRAGVLRVPVDALMDDHLFVIVSDTLAERRDVKTGLIGDEMAEITSGLNENDLVIVIGQQRLVGGERVKAMVR
jgi:multidrug efflux pump subunit AcrA (membrane-fusion protein)